MKDSELPLVDGIAESYSQDVATGGVTQTNQQTSKRNYWQVSPGSDGRDYSSIFLKYGVMFIGDDLDGKAYKSFANKVQIGDLVILRKGCQKGTWDVIAVGQVQSEYFFADIFEDVDGWDLRHCRRVQWIETDKYRDKRGFAMGRFQGINDPNSIQIADNVWNVPTAKTEPNPLPVLPHEVKNEALLDKLIGHGLSVDNSEIMTTTINKLRRLGKWYMSSSQDVSEHEIRTFLVVPLLMALGWPEQKLKIEWSRTGARIDIAAFSGVYSSKAVPSLLIETKAMGAGLQPGEKQLRDYAKNFEGDGGLKKIVVTDGIRYRMLTETSGNWELKAYMNLLTFRDRHPYESVGGAIELFLGLLP